VAVETSLKIEASGDDPMAPSGFHPGTRSDCQLNRRQGEQPSAPQSGQQDAGQQPGQQNPGQQDPGQPNEPPDEPPSSPQNGHQGGPQRPPTHDPHREPEDEPLVELRDELLDELDEPIPRARAARILFLDAWLIARRLHRDSNRVELMHRALGFAALGFVTLVPMLIVIAAAAPVDGHTFPTWVVVGLGLTGNSAEAVRDLFGPAGRVLSTTTALSLGTLAVFGLSFATAVQVGFERIWELPPARWYSVWRRVVWLAVLVGYLLGSADLVQLLHGKWFLSASQLVLSMISSTAFFWWSARFLLHGRVGWRDLLPGSLLTVAGLIGLRIFSTVLFSPLIISSALTYGAIGTVLVVVSWLIGVGFVIFGGAMCGRALAEARSAVQTTAGDPAAQTPVAHVSAVRESAAAKPEDPTKPEQSAKAGKQAHTGEPGQSEQTEQAEPPEPGE
jgi:membrane protein